MTSQPGLRVLLVEDEPILADLTAEMMMAAGAASVGMATTLEDAHHRLDDGAYDLLVLDIWIKGRRSVDVAAHAKRTGLRTCMVSGVDAPEKKSDDLFLRKPVKPEAWRRMFAEVAADQ